MMNRRDFLGTLGMLSAAGANAAPRAHRALHVVIVGAGLSGLCAAYELERQGHRVTVLEAEVDHLGGRVRTVHFGAGLTGELGAMRIPADHRLAMHYVGTFGLKLRRFVERDPDAFYFVHGRRQRVRDVRHPDLRYAIMGFAAPGSVWREEFHEIVGGMDRLPAAFASRLKGPILRGSEVLTLRSAPGSAAATFRQHGRLHQIEADAILCTVPLPLLKRMAVHPPLPDRQQEAIRILRYGSASKTLLLCHQRFWETKDGIYGGASYTDLPIGSIYYPADNATSHDPAISRGPGVLVASYALAANARRLESLPAGERIRLVLREAGRLHPELESQGMVLRSVTWAWDDYPWSRGAFAAPGQSPELVKRVAAPHGRIHFAGEHTSSHPTWMEGAFESAHRAVREILTTALQPV